MKSLLCGLAAFAALASAAQAQTAQATSDDPFQWLEDIEAPKSMSWVEGQNARSAKRLESDFEC